MSSARGAAAAWRALLGPALVLVAVFVAGRLVASRWEGWQAQLAALGPLAPVAYLALWLVLVPCAFPASALGLVAGAVFGPWLGCGWALAGLVMSGLAMHALGRRWLRPRVARLVAGRPRLARLERAAAAGGVRLHVLARLSPLNYALVSYTLAGGGARLRTYALGLSGGMPGLVAYVWLGAAARRGVTGYGTGGTTHLLVLVIGAISLLVLGVVILRALTRAGQSPGRDADQDA